MKLVVNTCIGGFGVNSEILKKYNIQKDREKIRTDEKLIQLIESGVNCNTNYSKLEVVDIPSEATDYYIENYDGLEIVLYVLNGKIIFGN